MIERLWAEGRTVPDIGELMGWAQNARGSRISRLRQLGYHSRTAVAQRRDRGPLTDQACRRGARNPFYPTLGLMWRGGVACVVSRLL